MADTFQIQAVPYVTTLYGSAQAGLLGGSDSVSQFKLDGPAGVLTQYILPLPTASTPIVRQLLATIGSGGFATILPPLVGGVQLGNFQNINLYGPNDFAYVRWSVPDGLWIVYTWGGQATVTPVVPGQNYLVR
jgi:hypothetical protein